MSRSIARRAVAATGALVLGVLAALGGAAPANAVPGNIDPTIARTLTIHKSTLTPATQQAPATGQLIPGGVPGSAPLAGAEFTVTLIPSVDLLTPAGWTTAGQLTPTTALPLATGTATTLTTDAAGLAVFSGLPVGLYLVQETATPAEVSNPAQPVLVTLPFPTGPGGTPANDWIYDVHLYPKNSTSALTKDRVVPAPGSVEARYPDLIRWSLNNTIPVLAPGETMSQFVLTDTIDPATLEFVATPPAGVAPTGVRVTNAAGAAQTFTAGTDYNLAATGTTQTLTFTGAGLTRLAGLGGGNVSLTVLSRAVSVPTNGLITNTAAAQVNGSTASATGTAAIGQLTMFAYATPAVPGGAQTPLAGAVFQLFLTQADADAGTNPITVGGANQWTTAANGQVLVPNLVPGTYYVREITPPAGFQIPVPATQAAQVVAGLTSTSAPVQNYLTVPHLQVPAFLLPLTGGDGAVWFGVGGAALLVIAVGAAVVVARRRTALARSAV